MQDHSHKFLFLGLTGLMSAAAFWASEAGPTLLVGKDAISPAIIAGFTPRDERDGLIATAPSNAPIAAKLAPDAACAAEASEMSPLCLGTSKVSLSSP
jgi:hypothetical protein